MEIQWPLLIFSVLLGVTSGSFVFLAVGELRAQREFLCDHLLNWIDRFTADVRKAAEDGFYFDLATFTEDFLTADAAELAEVLG